MVYLRVNTFDTIHDHPRPSVRRKLRNEGVVWVNVVLLHHLRVHRKFNLGTDEISSSIGLDNERVRAEHHEWVSGRPCDLVSRQRGLILVDQHLTLGL